MSSACQAHVKRMQQQTVYKDKLIILMKLTRSVGSRLRAGRHSAVRKQLLTLEQVMLILSLGGSFEVLVLLVNVRLGILVVCLLTTASDASTLTQGLELLMHFVCLT